MAHVFLRFHGFQVHEVNASDQRSYGCITSALRSACYGTVFDDKTAVVLEEVDGTFKGESIRAIRDFCGEYRGRLVPIVLTCNDLSKVRIPGATVVRFHPLSNRDSHTLLERVASSRGLLLSSRNRTLIVGSAAGDARQIVQCCRLDGLICRKDKEEQNPLARVHAVFQGKAPLLAHDLHLAFANYTRGVRDMDHLADLADCFSWTDVAVPGKQEALSMCLSAVNCSSVQWPARVSRSRKFTFTK
jgi:hypothetical protein